MDFARKQLEKYGWTDGKGLGKHENGISQPLKPKIKRSVTGVGHDPAADFTEHWWTTLYNKAANNLEVKEKDGKTKKIKEKDTGFEITNSTWKLTKKHKKNENVEQYSGTFVKTAVLTNGGVKTERVREEDSDDDEKEKKDVFKMTDEELFAACEGRTAHKGARHGLKASGKLARIQQQEEMLLIQPQFEGYTHAKKLKEKNINKGNLEENMISKNKLNDDEHFNVEVKVKNKKKKDKKRCEQTVEELVLEQSEDFSKKYKNKKKKKRCKSAEPQHIVLNGCNDETKRNGQAKMLNNKRLSDLTIHDLNLSSEDDSQTKKKNKRKRKSSNDLDKTEEMDELTLQDLNVSVDDCHIKKKNKRKNENIDEFENLESKKKKVDSEEETKQETEENLNDHADSIKGKKSKLKVILGDNIVHSEVFSTKKKKNKS